MLATIPASIEKRMTVQASKVRSHFRALKLPPWEITEMSIPAGNAECQQ